MPWAMFDDKSPSNPKLLKAGAEAAWLWHSSICYSNAHALDGKIDKELVTSLYPPLAPKVAKLALKLVSLNLWHDCGDHYDIHDYKHFQSNALKADVEERAALRREYERERKRQYRDENKKPSPNVPPFVPDKVPDSPTQVSADVPRVPAPAGDARSPIPSDPVPTETEERETRHSASITAIRPVSTREPLNELPANEQTEPDQTFIGRAGRFWRRRLAEKHWVWKDRDPPFKYEAFDEHSRWRLFQEKCERFAERNGLDAETVGSQVIRAYFARPRTTYETAELRFVLEDFALLANKSEVLGEIADSAKAAAE